jgi:hypothetical protein
MTKGEASTLPKWWYLALSVILFGGVVLFFKNPQVPFWVTKVTDRVRPDGWSMLFAIYLLSMVFSHFVVFSSLLVTKHLFVLASPTFRRRNLWPPALLGLLESVLYPTAFLIGRTDFIGLWLLLKVAGQWPRWTRETSTAEDGDAVDEGRRRYYQFLIGNALSVGLAAVSYAVMKMLVLV